MPLITKLFFIIIAINFLGCTTTPYITTPKIEKIPIIYHRVEKGQTLWRISKLYNVDLDELVQINNLSNASRIKVGQIIVIPSSKKMEPEVLKAQPSLNNDFIWPLRGKVISSFKDITGNTINKGIDIQADYGSDVIAAGDGKVIFLSDDLKSFGKTLIIQHADDISTVYARNSELLVNLGDNVKRGALIARVGSAGRTTLAYLHFEIRKKHIPQNPYYYLLQ